MDKILVSRKEWERLKKLEEKQTKEDYCFWVPWETFGKNGWLSPHKDKKFYISIGDNSICPTCHKEIKKDVSII